MLNVRTKITAIFLILSTYKTGFCQLSLENIFLTNKYVAVQADDVQFLHTKPLFAKLINTKKGENIAFFNEKNEKVSEWKLSEALENKNYNWRDLIISNTDNFFLVNTNCEQLYRRSFMCNYFYGDANGNLTSLSDAKQLYSTFSPNDKKIAFIKNNNLFYKEISSNTETQITEDGEWNKIINGKSDWVYEEELELTRAYEWNAQSDKIAYLKFDESNVKEYSIPLYYDMQYPNYFTYKYPKVGEENSKVSVWLYDVKSKKNKQIVLPYSYEYIPRIYWNASGDEVIAMLLNRHQDSLQLVGCNIKTKKTRQLYIETDKAYVEVPKTIRFLSDNSFMITSEKDGYNHLYHYDKDGKLIKQLTKNYTETYKYSGMKDSVTDKHNFEVTNVFKVDEKRKLIYYQSNESSNPVITHHRYLFSINYETLEKKQLFYESGTTSAQFSTDGSFYIRKFSSLKIPPVYAIKTITTDTEIVIENNRFLLDSLVPFLPRKHISGLLAENGDFNMYNIYPNDSAFYLSSKIPQPNLIFVYGGPGNEEVLNEWDSKSSNLFLYYLAQQGIRVTCIDPRGSSGKGAAFKKSTYLNLGKYETEDILDYVRWLKGDRNSDSMRFGIFGWSYGGFLAANCLFEGNDIFKVGIAVAPVSNWYLYNSIYTERYMRTPKENPIGYNGFNPNVLAKKMRGNLLLIHGTADDNVHFQHSIQLINALNKANKSYQLYLNPDAEHGTSSKKMRYDLYKMMYEFLKEKL